MKPTDCGLGGNGLSHYSSENHNMLNLLHGKQKYTMIIHVICMEMPNINDGSVLRPYHWEDYWVVPEMWPFKKRGGGGE